MSASRRLYLDNCSCVLATSDESFAIIFDSRATFGGLNLGMFMKRTKFQLLSIGMFVAISSCGRDGSTGNQGNGAVASSAAAVAAGSASTSATATSAPVSTTGTTPTPTATPDPSSTPAPTPTPTPTPAALDPNTCTVVPANELMITRVSVVEDAVRSTWSGTTGAQDGAWAIGRVLTRLSGAQDAGPYVNSLLNGLTADDSFIASNWPKANGAFTLTGTPMLLEAIVNRIDLRDPAAASLGELRFVFGTAGNVDGKIIVEIVAPTSTQYSALTWAQAWHRLSDPNLTSAQFNTALQVLTDYALDNAQTHYRVRTANETPFQPWTFRQFEPQSGLLVPANLGLTPAARFDMINPNDANSYFVNGNATYQQSQVIDPNDLVTLTNYVDSISADITTGNYSIPTSMGTTAFQMQRTYRSDRNSVVSDESWSIPSVGALNSATFSVNTCNGCHGLALVTGPSPAQVSPRGAGQASSLAAFLTGTSDGKFSDLQRRATEMSNVLCGTGATQAGNPVVIPNN